MEWSFGGRFVWLAQRKVIDPLDVLDTKQLFLENSAVVCVVTLGEIFRAVSMASTLLWLH